MLYDHFRILSHVKAQFVAKGWVTISILLYITYWFLIRSEEKRKYIYSALKNGLIFLLILQNQGP